MLSTLEGLELLNCGRKLLYCIYFIEKSGRKQELKLEATSIA